ncbi:MAG: hypothetical protein M3381_10640 [Actinomycetota bacterium]|nr:hypothetical protein [Actinomycetota bacterium]
MPCRVGPETSQVVRALQAHGPQSPEDLAVRVGAPYWETARFERALAFAQADGLVVRTAEGLLSAV